MLLDLFLLMVLGAALAWSGGAASWKIGLTETWASIRGFSLALLGSHLGRLLVLLAIAIGFEWSAQIAIAGWRSLDPSVATGELEEGERCHAWQRRITGATTADAFAPSELLCPVGGGRYAQDASAGISCGIHGQAP